jgi:hypothetical protein
MRWMPADFSSNGGTGGRVVTGLYENRDGTWYNPLQGVSLQPNYAAAAAMANPYDVTGMTFNWGLISSAIKTLSWLGGPVVGLAVNAIGDGYGRSLNGQEGWQMVAGGVGDATGISSIVNGIQQGSIAAFGMGVLQTGLTALSFNEPLGMLSGALPAGGPTMGQMAEGMGLTGTLAYAQSETAANMAWLSGVSSGPPAAGAIVGGGTMAVGAESAAAAGASDVWGGGGWLGQLGGVGGLLANLMSGGFGYSGSPSLSNRQTYTGLSAAENTSLVSQSGGLHAAALDAHSALANPIAIQNSAVAVIEGEVPGVGTSYYASGSGAYLSPAQRASLITSGVPEENIFSGAAFRSANSLENHAEQVILRNIPEGTTINRWGISWTTDQRPIPCSNCAPLVRDAGGTLEGN